jgi:diguanylate cyclase (GGDEF)-like protein
MSGAVVDRRRGPAPALLRRDGLLNRVLLQPAWLLALEVSALFLPLVIVFGLRLGEDAGRETEGQVAMRLGQLARAAAAVVDGDLHETLREPGQENGETYRLLLRPLARFHNAVPGIRNLYTMREVDGRLLFVLDTARSPDLSRETDPPAGFLSPLSFDLADEPQMMATLRSGRAHVDARTYDTATSSRPLRSVEAPIRNSRGEIVAFLSLDFDESYLADSRQASSRFVGRVLLLGALLVVLTIAGLVFWLRERIGDSLRALEREAKTDALTGLYNRRHFNRCLAREVERAAQDGAALGLLIFDVDHFKRINDTWGHPAGDAVLRRIGDCLRESTRYPQRAFRIGGEEFAVLLRGADATAAMALFQRLSAAIRRPVPLGDTLLEVTISGGIAALGAGETAERVLSRADQALYVAKNGGRDFAVVAATV